MSEPRREVEAASREANDRIKELQTLLEDAIIARREAEHARIHVLRSLAEAGRRQADEMQKRLDAEKRQADETRKRAEAERVATDEMRRRAEAEARAVNLAALVSQLRAQFQHPGGEP